MNLNDTIAAIATPPGTGGVCVIRISGPDAFAVADAIVPRHAPCATRSAGTFCHATFVDPATQRPCDDGLLLVFHAPHSYTGEDTVELQGHGGTLVARQLLAVTCAAGARLAEPGEFTRRAFLNGRLDLTRAEAVCDFIHAATDRAAAVARAQLDGSLGNHVTAVYDTIIQLTAEAEHLIDFDDGEIPSTYLCAAATRIAAAAREIGALADTWHTGRLLRDGATVVISGLPNAGKSSLMNALLGHARAIVAPAAGTTRDVIEDSCVVDGIPVRLIDTAGLRTTDDVIEREGIVRAREQMRQADIHLHVIDATLPALPRHAREELAALPPATTLVILSKRDCVSEPAWRAELDVWQCLSISSITGDGLPQLRQRITAMLGAATPGDSQMVISERQRNELITAADACAQASQLAEETDDWVLVANQLRHAAEALGRMLGKTWDEDILDRIFSRFCVGK